MIATFLLALLIAATFAIGLFGSLAGLVLGNLRLPLLLAALPPAVAGGTNITVSGAGAGAGALAHLKEGRFDRGAFLAMAPTSVVGAVLGGVAAGFVPGDVLLVIVSAIVLQQGYELLQYRPPAAPAPGSKEADAAPKPKWVWLAVAGLGIGILGGLIGLILGTIRLPVLLKSGVPIRNAVATNLAVGFLVGMAGLVGHLAGGTIDLELVLLLVPSAVVGGILGARLTGKLSETGLRHTVGAILIGVSAVLLLEVAFSTGFV